MEKKTHWGEVGSWYNDLVGYNGSEYHQEVIFPGVIKLLNNSFDTLKDKKILDLACGQGAFCRLLSSKEAVVTGLDLAPSLINAAKNYDKENTIKYLLGDATKIINDDKELNYEFKENEFDAITIILAIQNITPLSPVWNACKRLLKPNGILIIVMMHPSFRIPQYADWQWNEEKNQQERVIWKYLKSSEIEIVMHPGKYSSNNDDKKTIHFHRPLQSYINTLGNHNLYIEAINEWPSHKKEQVGKKSIPLDLAKEEIPMFLALKAKKF